MKPLHWAKNLAGLAWLCAGAVQAASWPTDPHLSGNAFLPPGLIALQNDTQNNPLALWLDKGNTLWREATGGRSCQGCHGDPQSMRQAAPSFPKLAGPDATLINLEDQILRCRARTGQPSAKLEDDEVLALSAVLHHTARQQPIAVQADATQPDHAARWQAHLERGAQLFTTRLGRMNLACVHCHDQNIGKQMRTDVVSPANPTGFPVYRMAWQRLGTIDRRLRACYSGVQAVLPAPGDPVLRDLELFLKVRAQGLPLDGPSIRR
jgi:L-cysteine S-thiosulfotransferase